MTAHPDATAGPAASDTARVSADRRIHRARTALVDLPAWPGYALLLLALTAFLSALVLGTTTEWTWAAGASAVLAVIASGIGVRRVRRSE